LVVLNRPNPLTAEEKRFLLTMALVAVPFIWVGIAMTRKRLRDAGQPNRLVFPFFIPAVNVVFFLLLCLLPSREDQEMAAKGAGALLRPICRIQGGAVRCWGPSRAPFSEPF
jgi:hypothetical protein